MNANFLIQEYFTLTWVDNPHKKRILTWGQFTKQTKYPRSKLSIRASGLNESLKLSIRHGEIEILCSLLTSYMFHRIMIGAIKENESDLKYL